MDRSLRRYRNRVAKAHRARILCHHWGWTYLVRPSWRGSFRHHWQPIAKVVMSERGHKWWRKLMMTRPDRSVEHHHLRLIALGRDPDSLWLPTHRDHWDYYW